MQIVYWDSFILLLSMVTSSAQAVAAKLLADERDAAAPFV
jgi:hypothetical protein